MASNRPILALSIATVSLGLACSPEPEGLAPAQPAGTTVKMDFLHRPLPEIPLPNDVATRYDEHSATSRRINASMLAPTGFESRTRELLDQLDGWGLFQPIVIPFTGPLDVSSVLAGHRDDAYDFANDVVYLIDIDRASPEYGKTHALDFGNGNYPVLIEDNTKYWKHDTRGDLVSLAFEEVDEDANGNGKLDDGEDANGNGVLDPGEDVDGDNVLDPPEDTDADGVLDSPNYLPGSNPDPTSLAQRADALMTFYEKSSNTLIGRPLEPLRERTKYAVVVTRRLEDAAGRPVGSPYPFINHNSQTEALQSLPEVLPSGIGLEDVAFAFSFTTQTVQSDWVALRDGLYGTGPQAHLNSDFEAKIDGFERLRDEDKFPSSKRPHLLFGEQWSNLAREVSIKFNNVDENSQQLVRTANGIGYIDYFVIGSFTSPQLFERFDADDNFLPLNDQSWPQDLHRVPASARGETIYFTLAVPRKEISARGQGKPAPLVIQGHGYTSQRFEGMQFAGFMARHGLAVLSIDGPGHGINVNSVQRSLAEGIGGDFGLKGTISGILKDRALDQNADGVVDSGADFWTTYLFHTRDNVRQFALDYMQALRIVKSFDGERKWAHDTNGDGSPNLAGDFDGDGEVDIGAGSDFYMLGASLGGIMSMVVGAVEPDIKAIAPIAGGGGYADIGIRSKQGGVTEAFILRAMGPLFTGELDPATGALLVETTVPDLNSDGVYPLGTADDVKVGDTFVVDNLANHERGCGYISPSGTVRAAVESDRGDLVSIRIFRGPQLVTGSHHCELKPGAEPFVTMDTFRAEVTHQGQVFSVGEPLVALEDGLGLQRGHPDLRRFQGLGQLILDPADPATLARGLLREPISYPGTGQQTGSHVLCITTMGDMNVPASSGVSVGRAAGLIDYLNVDPRFGKPANQELIDNYTIEAVHSAKRYVNGAGKGVHLDVENFAQSTDLYGSDIPRASTPMRLGIGKTDALGGASAAIFPYNVPEGQHGFDLPGGMTDRARKQCKKACATTTGPDPCGCDALPTFDIGTYMFNMIGAYFASGGKKITTDLCLSSDDCSGFPDPPAARDPNQLD